MSDQPYAPPQAELGAQPGASPEVIDAETRRRNRKLGIALGVLAFGLMITFIVRFTIWGMPQDPEENARRRQRASGFGQPTAAQPSPAPAPAPAGPADAAPLPSPTQPHSAPAAPQP